MPTRPYINYTTTELEAVASDHWDNATVLTSLSQELSSRKRLKAQRLLSKIQYQIDRLQVRSREHCNIEQCQIVLPSRWFKGIHLDRALIQVGSPYNDSCRKVMFHFPAGANMMLEAGIRILSMANCLSAQGKEVFFKFDDPNVFSYLNRMEFFLHLDPRIIVLPNRPDVTFKGRSVSLVEIGEIVPGKKIGTLPGKLTATFCNKAGVSNDSTLGHAAYTVFSEMIGNVQEHSETELSGYAALQVYRPTRSLEYIQVVVSDSGRGVVNTIRPALHKWYPDYEKLADGEIIGKMFEQGLSRYGPHEGHGLGFRRSWQQAMKTKSRLVVRQGACSVTLKHLGSKTTPNIHSELAPIHGTHISFEFYLD
jgi:hypothetical protein